MKVIIAGSRNITDKSVVLKALVEAGFRPSQITEIVSGTARGVDQLGEQIAQDFKIPAKRFPANWDEFGKSAGYRRNSEMAVYADRLVAVWDGKSRGTEHMIDLMRSQGKPFYVYMTGGGG